MVAMRKVAVWVFVSMLVGGCCRKAPPTPDEAPARPEGKPDEPRGNQKQSGGVVPPDGKYEGVTVEGKSVAMVQVMNGGDIVLVDVDGQKPRTWEEQYKRKGDAPRGSFNLHKTDANKNGSFEDDQVDRQGTWHIDAKGNLR